MTGRGALNLAARSGRGGTTGRAAGWPASGRPGAGERASGHGTDRDPQDCFRTRALRAGAER